MVGKRSLRNAQPLGHPELGLGDCPLCGRPLVAGKSIDEHHLLPKSQGGREKYFIHRICHRKIHATFSEKELAKNYSAWTALREQEAMAVFIAWVKKKPPEYYDNSRASAGRR
jgi:hypothetical protein